MSKFRGSLPARHFFVGYQEVGISCKNLRFSEAAVGALDARGGSLDPSAETGGWGVPAEGINNRKAPLRGPSREPGR